jgi:tetratricopeptide (TPR) repeat protein
MLHRYAALLEQSGEYEKSLSMLTDEENLRRELEDRPGLQSCYNEQFRTFQLKDDDEMALAVAGKQETLAREMSDQRLVRLALERQLYLLEKLGDADGARSALIELVQCAREESDSEALMLYLSKEMRFLTQLRRWAEARDSALEYRNLAIESGASDQANKADQLLQQIRVVVDSELPSQAGQESSDSEEFKGDADDLKSVRDQDSDDQPETADSEMPTMSFDEHIQELRQLLNVVPPVWFALTIVAFFLLPQDGLLERMLTAIAWTAIPAYLLWCVQMWRFCAEGLTGKEAFGLAAGLLVTPGVLLALSRAALLPDYVWKVAFDIPMRDSWTLGWGKLAAIFIIVGLCSANVIYALLLSKKLKDKQSSWNSRRSRSLNEIQMGIKLAAQSGVIGALVVIAAPAAVVSAFLLPLQAYLVILSGKSLIR